jgi:hypothetical protein
MEGGLVMRAAPPIERAQLSISKANTVDGLPPLLDTGDVTGVVFFFVIAPE